MDEEKEAVDIRFTKSSFAEQIQYVKHFKIKEGEFGWVYNTINAFLNDTLGTALGGYSKHSFQNYVNTMKNGFKTGTRTREWYDEVKMVNAASEALCSFIQQFMLYYIKYVPVYPEAPFSSGTYSLSSMLYFNSSNENSGKGGSKQAASYSDDFMHQHSNVLHILKERVKTKEEAQKRIALISGGLTLENTANSDGYYYGWKNVENDGWTHKDGTKKKPYRPFGHALKAIPKTYVVNGYKITIKYRAHNVRPKHYKK